MTDAEPTPRPPGREGRQTAPRGRWRPRRPATRLGWTLAGLAGVFLFLAAVFFGVRYGVLLPQARLMIEARTDGLKIGRFGRLKIEGIGGDIWTHFTVRRLTISDEAGVWAEADNLDVRWHYIQLLRRRLDVNALSAKSVTLIRRPTFDTHGTSSGMPVSVQIDKLDTRVEMLPAFSSRRGLYDLSVRDLVVTRRNAARLKLTANSLMHAGDHVIINFDLGRKKQMKIDADALEAQGGSIAGALGLAADQPFSFKAKLAGTMAAGQLSVASHSGKAVPIVAQGAWNHDGGAVNAHVQLTASSHLTSWARWLGPEADVAIVGRQTADKGVYDFDVRGIADNVNLVAKGPVRPGEQKALGLKTTIVIGDVNRIFTSPKMGQLTLTGDFTGGFKSFKLIGAASLRDILWGKYGLAEVAGPTTVSFAKGELDVVTDAKGRGGFGAGQDWKYEVAGAAPYGAVHMVRLTDGRLLFRSLDITGDKMRLKGEGTRSIFGRLDFKGDLEVDSLVKANKNFDGTAHFTWTAYQKTDRDPWYADYKGVGDHFTTGVEWLDKVIGPNPHLTGTGIADDTGLTIPKAVMNGGQADLETSGKLDADSKLNFKGTWTVRGPFEVGPFEVNGEANGTGAMTGTLDEPKTDLQAEIQKIDLPTIEVRPAHLAMSFVSINDSLVGGFAVNGDTDFGPARARSQFRFIKDGMDLTALDADLGGVKAKGSLSLRNNTPSTADLTLDIGRGALLTDGRAVGSVKIVDAAGGPTADVKLQTGGAVLRGTTLALDRGVFSGRGPISHMPYHVEAKGAFNRNPMAMTGSGEIATQDGRWAISFAGGGQARAVRFSTIEPVVMRMGNGEASARMRLNLGGGKAAIDAHQVGDAVGLIASLQGVDVGFVAEDFTGRFDAELELQGKGKTLTGSMKATLDDARSRDAAAKSGMSGQVKATLRDSQVTIDSSITSGQGLKASGNFVLPAEASAEPLHIAIARTRPMRGQFDATGEVRPLWDLFFGGERTLSGQVAGHGVLAGTINDPQITGQASLQNGAFKDFATGLVLKDLEIAAQMDANIVQVKSFSASDNTGGKLAGSGRASLERGGGGDFTVQLTKFRMIDNDVANADATGKVSLTRAADGRVKIAGDLVIDQAQINAAAKLASNVPTMDVVEINRPTTMMTQLAPVTHRGPGAALDVRMRAPGRIFVKGRGLNMEMSVVARVTGTTIDPVLDGEARIVRGDYDFAGKRFEFDDRGTVRLSDNPEQIRLDLSATRDDPSLTAVVKVQGTAAKPEITLTSTPVLPKDEVLSQVLFGRSASQLSPLEAAQLASALTALATGGGFDVVGGLRNLAGLDRLSLVGGGQDGGVGLAGGKYLTENVYLEIVGGGRDGAGAEVDYRVNRNLSVTSKLTSQQGAQLSVRWRKDIGGRRGRSVVP